MAGRARSRAGSGASTAGTPRRRGLVRARHDRRRAARGAGAARRGARRAAVAAVHRRGRRGAARAARRAAGPARAALRARGCRSAWSPRRRRCRWSRAYGEPRFKLDVNWDPETVAAFLELPAAEAHGRSLPGRPVPARAARALPAHVRRRGRRRTPREVLERLRARARRGDRRRPPLARRTTARALDGRGPARRRAAPVPARRRRLRAASRGACSSPTSRASARPCEALAALEDDDAYPAVVVCPASAEAQLAARDRALAARTARCTVVVGHRQAIAEAADITVLNYEIVHAHRERLALRAAARRSCSTSRTTSRTRAPSARRPCAGWPRRCPRARCGSR